MNILGIGGMELVFILIIMLVVAGPKRMIQWAYYLGQYAAKARAMWEETMKVVQKELDDAGVDIQVPKEMPTRANLSRHINQQVNRQMQPITRPVRETLDELDRVKKMATAPTTAAAASNGQPERAPTPPRVPPSDGGFGTWSQPDAPSDKGTGS